MDDFIFEGGDQDLPPLVLVLWSADDLGVLAVSNADLLAEGVIVPLLLVLPPTQSANDREELFSLAGSAPDWLYLIP